MTQASSQAGLHQSDSRSGRAMESDTVWIYVDTNHRIGHPHHLKVFADQDAAHAWFAEHDYEVSRSNIV
jgi:hypothetical protein